MSNETEPRASAAHDCWASEVTSLPGATENSTNANVADDSKPAGRSASGRSASGRGETIAKLGTVLSAIMASSCCWLPPLLIVAGVSGAGIVTALETYRPLFMVVTFSFLGAAFYFTYRPRRGAAQEDCCAPAKSGRGRLNMMAVNKAMLWAVTVMAVVFLFFPQYVTALVAPDHGQLTADMDRATVAVEGMTCPGWEVTAARAIRKAPGVLAVEVDYESGEAIIGTAAGGELPQRAVLSALESIGYQGKFIELPGDGQ